MYGLSVINIELTDSCNKDCWMCGRRQRERENPGIKKDYGDMDFELLAHIARQLPDNILVQLHNNGEPLLYPKLGDALKLFSRQITSFDTNGKLLIEKANELIDNVDTIAVSVIENDPEAKEQYKTVMDFVKMLGGRRPVVIIRALGKADIKYYELYRDTKKMICQPQAYSGFMIARRTLHAPGGSFDYRKQPTIPEHGICLDMLSHLAINRKGLVSPCVRYDPDGIAVIGDSKTHSLHNIWNGETRKQWLDFHKRGLRKAVPLCSKCDYWGVPTGE